MLRVVGLDDKRQITAVFAGVVQLFSVQNVSELCNLGKYLYLASKKRNNT